MSGIVRQALRASKCRGYQHIGSQLLNGSKVCSRNAALFRSAVVGAARPDAVIASSRVPWDYSSFSTSAVEAVKETPALKAKNYVGGKFVESQSTEHIDVLNPATQEVVSRVPLTTHEEFETAVAVAKEAYKTWRKTPVTARQRVMLKLQELIRRDMDKLAMSVTLEQGKTLADARGDVFRGLEVYKLTSLNFSFFVFN